MTKFIDLCVATGKYKDKDGNEKTRYENIGKIVQKDDGGEFILLKRTFNPAGVPNPEDRDTVLVSMFSQKENNGGNASPQQSRPSGQQTRQQPAGGGGFQDFEDDIPF